jgi:hypothetical protein
MDKLPSFSSDTKNIASREENSAENFPVVPEIKENFQATPSSIESKLEESNKILNEKSSKNNLTQKRITRELTAKYLAYDDDISKKVEEKSSQYDEDLKSISNYINNIKIDVMNNNTSNNIINKFNNLKTMKNDFLNELEPIKNNLDSTGLLMNDITSKLESSEEDKKVIIKNMSKFNAAIDSIKDSKEILKDTSNKYIKLINVSVSDFNNKFNELKNNLKIALIQYYTKLMNEQITKNNYNKNLKNIANSNSDKQKVEILKNMKTKLIVLQDIFNKFKSSI